MAFGEQEQGQASHLLTEQEGQEEEPAELLDEFKVLWEDGRDTNANLEVVEGEGGVVEYPTGISEIPPPCEAGYDCYTAILLLNRQL